MPLSPSTYCRDNRIRPWERKLAIVFFSCALGLALWMQSCQVHAAQATMQSKEPWSLAQCDKLVGHPVLAVFNVSLWNSGGWPLWHVTCLF
jgi:hypothetical protein